MDGPDIEGLFKCPSRLGERISYRLAGNARRFWCCFLRTIRRLWRTVNSSNKSVQRLCPAICFFSMAESSFIGTQSSSRHYYSLLLKPITNTLQTLPIGQCSFNLQPQSSNLSRFG